jgi:hypothetical protein
VRVGRGGDHYLHRSLLAGNFANCIPLQISARKSRLCFRSKKLKEHEQVQLEIQGSANFTERLAHLVRGVLHSAPMFRFENVEQLVISLAA